MSRHARQEDRKDHNRRERNPAIPLVLGLGILGTVIYGFYVSNRPASDGVQISNADYIREIERKKAERIKAQQALYREQARREAERAAAGK